MKKQGIMKAQRYIPGRGSNGEDEKREDTGEKGGYTTDNNFTHYYKNTLSRGQKGNSSSFSMAQTTGLPLASISSMA